MNVMLLLAVLLSAPLAAPGARGQSARGQSADVKAIKDVQSRLNAAFQAKNAAVVESLFSKGFTETANGMTFNREQALAQMTQGMAASRVVWTMSGVRVTGNRAAFTSGFRFETKSVDNSGMFGPKGKAHTMSGAGLQKVQMVKSGGHWLYDHLELVTEKTLVDGKAFNPAGPVTPAKKPAR